jgi:hypothetical protein
VFHPLRDPRPLVTPVVVSLLFALVATIAPTPAAAGVGVRNIASSGFASLTSRANGSGAFQPPEFVADPDQARETAAAAAAAAARIRTNRSKSNEKGDRRGARDGDLKVPVVSPTAIDAAAPGKGVNFEGLRHRDQRLANGGNQFSLEPPDQGLCVGGAYVLETVNDVLRVYSKTTGAPITGVIDQNTFYGYPAAINRATGARGPFITDPSCYYDTDTDRWFHVVLTLDVVTATGAFTGKNHLDLAVSQTGNPAGAWKIYRIPVQDDGTDGTPNHGCSQGPCIGDFPHIGADRNGFYITTNEYSFFGPEFISAQIYAISKKALAMGASSIRVVQLDDLTVGGGPAFTVWPAIAPAAQYATGKNGTEYFLSSMAGEEAGNTKGIDNRLGLWTLTNTRSLDSSSPDLKLKTKVIGVETYAIPPAQTQKAGDFPLGQCINDTTAPTPFGPGCWQNFFVAEPAHDEVESRPDSSDTRMMQVTFAGGLVYGALDTAVRLNGVVRAGIAWFIIQPNEDDNDDRADRAGDGEDGLVRQGYLAATNHDVTYPAVAVLPNGKGVMAFTLTGSNFYPSAAYVTLSARNGTSAIHVAQVGTAPDDGFTGYKAFVGDPPRTRWGDYGAAAVDGSSIWLASEYIAQPPCTLTQYMVAFSCGATRTSLGNWSTRVTQVTP